MDGESLFQAKKHINSFFSETGSNMFNKATVNVDKYLTNEGRTYSNTGYYTSDYISVLPNTSYILRVCRYISYYDSLKKHISSTSTDITANLVITTPANAAFFRFSWYKNDVTQSLDVMQVNKGKALLTYEPYKAYIKSSLISILETGLNLFDKSTVNIDKDINQTNGDLYDRTGFYVSDYIPVAPSTSYVLGYSRAVAYYDSSKTKISTTNTGTTKNKVITTPANAAYIRFSWYKTDVSLDALQVSVGSTVLPYEPYATYIKASYIPPDRTAHKINLPTDIPAVVGKEINIYYNNITELDLSKYQIKVSCTIGNPLTTKWNCTPTTAGTYPITITIYEHFTKVIASVTSNIVVKDASVGTGITKTCLIIGDSFIGSGKISQHLIDLFGTDVMDIQLLGTLGTAPNSHEGRSGWTAENFRHQTNPFCDGTDFNFAKYMTDQSYSGVDYVFIHLGNNDMFHYFDETQCINRIPAVVADFTAIINSIQAYNTNIKIGLMCTIPPNQSQDVYGAASASLSGQTSWRFDRNTKLWVQAELAQLCTINNVYPVPTNAVVDCVNNISDWVHPKDTGYNQMGDMVYSWIKSFES